MYDTQIFRALNRKNKKSNSLIKSKARVPFSIFTSDAGIDAEPSRLSAVIALLSTVLVVPLIWTPYIPPTSHNEMSRERHCHDCKDTIVKHRVEPANPSLKGNTFEPTELADTYSYLKAAGRAGG